jgi:hypothetical protein
MAWDIRIAATGGSPALRMGLWVSTAFATVLAMSEAARAACDPNPPANGDTVTCTGTTTNQGPSAQTGYGAGVLTNLHITVMPGASVTGTSRGIAFIDGTVINSGGITGNSEFGIIATTNATVTNSGSITGHMDAISSGVSATVDNSGFIAGTTGNGIEATAGVATVINSGTITGSSTGIYAGTSAIVTNSGSIEGTSTGIYAVTTAVVTNSGAITGDTGIHAGIADVTNSGAIRGGSNGIYANETGKVTTSGTIIGGNGTAIRFNGNGIAASDTLTILPGARFGGVVNFGGGADRVNFGPGSWVLDTAQYDAALSTVTTPGTPYFITPNQIIVTDLSGVRVMIRAVMDITGWISSVLPDSPMVDTSAISGASAFVAFDSAATRFDDAFENFPSALPYTAAPVFKGGTATDAEGNSFWAKGFGGRREQTTEKDSIGSVTIGWGIAIGYDRQITANTRLGALVGGSRNESRFDLNAGSLGLDAMFGGVYSRTFFGASFLDLAVIGGTLDNESKRNIDGIASQASARYDGWFITPLLTLGHRFALPYNLTLTPALKARYVAAHFDGHTESGSNANLTVADHDFQGFEERAEVTLARVQYWGSSRIIVRAHTGMLARQYAGDKTLNVALIGQDFIAAIAEDNTIGLYGGAGFEWQTGRVALFAAGEVIGMNGNTTTFAGKGGMRAVW